MAYTIYRPATHEDWLEARMYGIGSSEAGTLMGVNHFDTPYRLWRRKMGLDGPSLPNDAMEMGHHLEPSVASLFAARTGASIRRDSAGDWIAMDNDRPFLRVSPDRLYYGAGERHSKKNLHILECKTSSMMIDKNDIPAYWYCQIQYQMGVMGVRSGALAWICSFPKLTFDYVEVEFNKAFYELLVEEIEKFWTVNVQGGVAPEDVRSDDTLLRYPTANQGETCEADAALQDKYNRLKELGMQIKDCESQKSSLEDDLKIAMGSAESLVTPGGIVLAQWKTAKDSQKFNAKAFQTADPAGYAKYVETVPGGRRFTIK